MIVNPNERIITWSDILNVYKYFKDNYFYQLLEYAIKNQQLAKPLRKKSYNTLSREKNYRGILSFADIKKFCETEGNAIIIGFNGGKNALERATLKYLINRNYKWDYEMAPKGKKVKPIWITGSEFLKIISYK